MWITWDEGGRGGEGQGNLKNRGKIPSDIILQNPEWHLFLPNVFLDFFIFWGKKEREMIESTHASFSLCREHFSGGP